jgi:biotin transport system substrate-specific component
MTASTGRTAALPRATLAEVIVPAAGAGQVATALRAVALVVAGAAVTAAAAQLSAKLPWSPVPYTGQTAAVLLVGTALGWRLGIASMALYVLAGVVGMPVFSGGSHGLDQLLGYTGGYLVGFVVAAGVVGELAQRGWDRSAVSAAGLMAAGNLLIYAIGVPVLAAAAGLSLADAIWNGAAVFLPWDAFKISLAAGLLPLAWRALGRSR